MVRDTEIADAELQHGYYVVGVFDLLGQSSRLEQLKEIPAEEDQQERDEAEALLVGTAGAVSGFRRLFLRDFVELPRGGREENGSAHGSRNDGKGPDTLDKRAEVFFWGASDTFFLAAPLAWEELGLRAHVSPILDMYIAAARQWLIGLCEDMPLRGAMEVGTAIPLPSADGGPPQDVYGQALLAAHRLESEVADWSRIIVGPQLASLLTDIVQREGEPEIDSATLEDARRCLRMTRRDTDGQLAVDGLGEAALDGFMEPLHESKHVLRAHEKVLSHYARFRERAERERKEGDSKEGDSKEEELFRRYEALLEYFQEYAPMWYAAPETQR